MKQNCHKNKWPDKWQCIGIALYSIECPQLVSQLVGLESRFVVESFNFEAGTLGHKPAFENDRQEAASSPSGLGTSNGLE